MILVQKKPKAIKLGIPHDDYSAMQGPAPDGFHVPLSSEWTDVKTIWTDLGGGASDGANFGIALKMPAAGNRNQSSNIYNQGSLGFYWSSSRCNASNAYYFYLGSIDVGNQYRVSGYSVRCFKDAPTIPTSSWNKLYGTSIEEGGIFWSSTDGLISLSSDGTTWITIADKNLGATQVWNSGDTLSEANCGKYYQWGNNYGFPRTGSVSTASTQVDASAYGPGNYYSSSIYRTINSYPYRWDSTDNGNLRGGETGIVQKADTDIKKVYLGSTQVRPVINFATQGPCPDGFHVPTRQEWRDVANAVAALGLARNNTTLETYLKMPTAGYRREGSASDSSYSNYWSANYFNDTYAYILQATSAAINAASGWLRTFGLYIRPFRNFPITPDSSWTTLHQGSGSAGIFWNSTLGLISISSDGTTWYTLKDKNLGATTVFNYGDELTDGNCGNVFQRGNNYPFPGTKSSASISKSGTQVDVTGYGPGNYYSRGIWVTASPRQNSASNGNNLRGGVDGNVPV